MKGQEDLVLPILLAASKLPSWYARPSQHATARSELAEVPATSCLVQQICRMQELKMYRTESFGNTMGSCQKDTGRYKLLGNTGDKASLIPLLAKLLAFLLHEKKWPGNPALEMLALMKQSASIWRLSWLYQFQHSYGHLNQLKIFPCIFMGIQNHVLICFIFEKRNKKYQVFVLIVQL